MLSRWSVVLIVGRDHSANSLDALLAGGSLLWAADYPSAARPSGWRRGFLLEQFRAFAPQSGFALGRLLRFPPATGQPLTPSAPDPYLHP